jgi:serine protease inhibitor
MPNLEVVMPKFTFRSKFLLGRTLAKLGMRSAF